MALYCRCCVLRRQTAFSKYGFRLRIGPNKCVVQQVVKNSLAEKTGLLESDIILGINQHSIENKTAEEIVDSIHENDYFVELLVCRPIDKIFIDRLNLQHDQLTLQARRVYPFDFLRVSDEYLRKSGSFNRRTTIKKTIRMHANKRSLRKSCS